MSKRAADGRGARLVLPADAQLCDDRSVPLDVLTPEVVEHPTPPSDEHQQAALAVKVLLVDLHVLGQMANALREQRDLHLGRPCVGVVQAIVADRCCLVGHTRMSLYRSGTTSHATTGGFGTWARYSGLPSADGAGSGAAHRCRGRAGPLAAAVR